MDQIVPYPSTQFPGAFCGVHHRFGVPSSKLTWVWKSTIFHGVNHLHSFFLFHNLYEFTREHHWTMVFRIIHFVVDDFFPIPRSRDFRLRFSRVSALIVATSTRKTPNSAKSHSPRTVRDVSTGILLGSDEEKPQNHQGSWLTQ